jgi:hypothetical protein
MRRGTIVSVLVGACAAGAFAQGDGGYRLVANWPHLPSGM